MLEIKVWNSQTTWKSKTQLYDEYKIYALNTWLRDWTELKYKGTDKLIAKKKKDGKRYVKHKKVYVNK